MPRGIYDRKKKSQSLKEKPLDKTLKEFIGVTAKTKVTVVVPLFGYWADIPKNPVNGEVLRLALSRLYSNIHSLYVIFVAHPESLSNDLADPTSVTNILIGWTKRGNVLNIPVGRKATYNEYLIEGLRVALDETDSQFIMVFNPWIMIQEGAIDVLIDRANRSDDAKVISGYDLRSIIEPENFDKYNNSMPVEERDLQFNLTAMPRYVAEMITLDPEYHTHVFLQADLWQQIKQKSFEAITSQRIPIFPFDFPWSDYEKEEDFEADRKRFIGKWTYDPGLKYIDPEGIGRKDKTHVRQV